MDEDHEIAMTALTAWAPHNWLPADKFAAAAEFIMEQLALARKGDRSLRVQSDKSQTAVIDPLTPLLTSESDEALMRKTLAKCYGTKTLGFRVSAEHYRYLAEQIVALREAQRRARVRK